MPEDAPSDAPGLAGIGVNLEVNPEDTVPFRPQPVFISLGLKAEAFTAEAGGRSRPNIPPLDLAKVAGQQGALAALGFNPGPIDGLPGPKTRAGTLAFQAANGLAPDGVMWPQTLSALQAGLAAAGIPFTIAGIKQPTAIRPQLFLVEHYQLASFRGDLARDDMIGSVSLSPRTSVSYKLIVKKKTTQSNELTSTVMDSQDQAATDSFNKQVKESSDAKFGKNNYNYGFDASFHGEAQMGLGSGSVDAEVHAQGSTNEVREDFAQSTASAIDTQVSQTNRARQERMVTGTSTTQTDEETESVMEKTTNNPSSQPLNIGIYQVKEEFITILSLVHAEIAFRNGNPDQDRTASLHQLGELLGAVVERPEDRGEAIRCIRSVLEGVRDYREDARSLLKDDPSNAIGFSVDRHLESSYELKKADGTVRRTLAVPGVIIREYRRYLRIPGVTVELPISAG
jgi:peptidoglycan hydrolase-like protein with peptidoglycan-binding domain